MPAQDHRWRQGHHRCMWSAAARRRAACPAGAAAAGRRPAVGTWAEPACSTAGQWCVGVGGWGGAACAAWWQPRCGAARQRRAAACWLWAGAARLSEQQGSGVLGLTNQYKGVWGGACRSSTAAAAARQRRAVACCFPLAAGWGTLEGGQAWTGRVGRKRLTD